jgi:hypothetical protein
VGYFFDKNSTGKYNSLLGKERFKRELHIIGWDSLIAKFVASVSGQ